MDFPCIVYSDVGLMLLYMQNLDLLVKELCKLPDETGWVEFKYNNDEPHMIGEDIGVLDNI